MNVILNEVKNLLSGNTLSTLSMVGFEEIATSGIALLAMTMLCASITNSSFLIKKLGLPAKDSPV